jgi:hypothetical protein
VTATFAFTDAEAPTDSYEPIPDAVPDLSDVEYPCEVCGRESGPYGGRGRKPKRCAEHKKSKSVTSTRKLTGTSANLAAQATATLVQINGLLAVGAMAVGMFQTASAIAEHNAPFEEKAYQALLTDPELCKLIVKGGVKSAKLSLGIAYAGFLVPVGMIGYNEAKELQAQRAQRKAEMNDGA